MTLVAIGGAADDKGDMIILKRVLAESKGTASRVHIVITATEFPKQTRKDYIALFKSLGVDACTVTYIDSRQQAGDAALVKSLDDADVIFFSGGDQLRLSSILGGTAFIDKVKEREAAGAIIAGTSAGAAAMTSLMIYDGMPERAMHKGAVMMAEGFQFVEKAVFDTHFMNRNRLDRLFNAVATNPGNLGVGLDEDTAIITHDRNVIEVIGSGTVTIVDGLNGTSNICDVGMGKAFTVENFTVETLRAGERYSLTERKRLAP